MIDLHPGTEDHNITLNSFYSSDLAWIIVKDDWPPSGTADMKLI